MKLTIEHLAPYLPYGLKVQWSDGKITTVDMGLTESDYLDDKIGAYLLHFAISDKYPGEVSIKPLLRPLSQLTETITHNGETFVPLHVMRDKLGIRQPDKNIETMNYRCFEQLVKWHFDVFNLIDNNLAITLNQK